MDVLEVRVKTSWGTAKAKAVPHKDGGKYAVLPYALEKDGNRITTNPWKPVFYTAAVVERAAETGEVLGEFTIED